MTEYAYKLVSLKLGGQPDWPALERAMKRGWEPVPLGEEPNPFPNPLDMTPQQLESFKLCRMPQDKHDEQREEREFLTAALENVAVHKIIAQRNIEAWIGEHSLDVDPQNLPENALEVASSTVVPVSPAVLARQVRVAYDWLHARGLA